jgi:spore coat protein A
MVLKRVVLPGLVALAVTLGTGRAQQMVDLPAAADNTLYYEPTGAISNGSGTHMFAGNTDDGFTRRAVVRFDLSIIPQGSTIHAATLTLNMSRTRAGNTTVTLHRLNASWGEGASVAGGGEGGGAPSELNDATWIHRFYSNTFWTTPGGDFNPTPSASTVVGNNNGTYTWSSAAMAADVQAWLADPASNFGWLIKGNESTSRTAKRFDTREHSDPTVRPRLTLVYTPPAGTTGACCLPGGTTCVTTTEALCAAQGGTYRGDGTSCTPNPCTGVQQREFIPSKDNTLYETVAGELSNGAGTGFIVGTDNSGVIRRAVLAFDLSSIPPGSTITGATLRVYMAWTQATTPEPFTVHRLTQDWGEGTSVAGGQQTTGAPSTPNDATWLHRFYPAQFWSMVGGTFVSTPSASGPVGATAGYYEWSGAGLIADVQSWVNSPSTNFGWILRSGEAGTRSQRRFDSKDSLVTTRRPVLVVTYTPPPPTGACCLPSGACVTATAAQCAAQSGIYRGDGSNCAAANCIPQLTPFVDALPLPSVAQPTVGVPGGAAHYDIPIREIRQQLHRDLPLTTVWGYAGSYPGPTIEARRGLPVTVTWINDLRDLATGQLRTRHYLPVDLCLHGPSMFGEVPMVVTHLHGGHVGAESDGYPEAVIAPGQSSTLYTYPNDQPAATLWYHDHALGITRLNVYMGLAGFYLLRDAHEDALPLPRGEYEIPLAIQDRSFNPDGSLKYPDMWMEHFFGDFILVNGKVWPYLDVKRGKYRFRVLNGSTSRTYSLRLSNDATFWQIASDTGLLETPVPMTSLTLTPGERADLVVDFAPYAPGTEIILLNTAPAPFPGTPGVGVIPNVMKFIVGAQTGHITPLPATLVPVPRLEENSATVERDFILRKMPHHGCPMHHEVWAINDLLWDDITEYPRRGSTEIWSWINRSGVTHPMHMHLVSFQILDRQDFQVIGGVVTPVGPRIPPPPNEMGWKDTVAAHPGQITRVIARFDTFLGRFPYHCHILEHEDHEMMRQFEVVCEADWNADGTVDFNDFLAFLNDYNAAARRADLNGDGTIDFNDFLEFLNLYNLPC